MSGKKKAQPAESRGKLDFMTVGDICVDLIMTGNVRPQFHQVEQIVGDCSLELGGSATIFASQLAKLGGRVGVVGWTGSDLLGRFVVEQLQGAGVDTSLIRKHRSLKTGIGVALAEENDRAILTYMGTIDATRPIDLRASLLRTCQHWHIASYFLLRQLREFWPSWLAKCKRHGLTTSLDTNWDPENRWDGVWELLPHVDVLLLNENEALAISARKDVVEAGRLLASRSPLVVIKRGEEGVLAFQGKNSWKLQPNKANGLPGTIADSVGAGDNFDAGFLRSWLLGSDVEACLQLGHRCAISSLRHQGGTRGQIVEVVAGPKSAKPKSNRAAAGIAEESK
jgi:sugar/nucleoside kinase (ribokinase family)